MSVQRIASRYAKSLLELASEHNKLDRVHEDVAYFNELTTKSRDFYLMLKSPIIKGDKKHDILEAIVKPNVDELTWAFVEIIVRKGRETYLVEIGRSFDEQFNVKKGIKHASIETAEPIDDQLRKEIEQAILKSTGSNVVELENIVDKDMIGGFVLRYDDKMFNASIAHKLETLKKEFSENTYIKKF